MTTAAAGTLHHITRLLNGRFVREAGTAVLIWLRARSALHRRLSLLSRAGRSASPIAASPATSPAVQLLASRRAASPRRIVSAATGWGIGRRATGDSLHRHQSPAAAQGNTNCIAVIRLAARLRGLHIAVCVAKHQLSSRAVCNLQCSSLESVATQPFTPALRRLCNSIPPHTQQLVLSTCCTG